MRVAISCQGSLDHSKKEKHMRAKGYLRIWLAGLLCSFLMLTVFGAQTAWAKYPEKNIKVIVHVTLGEGTGLMARIVVKYLDKKLGKKFIVENQMGAGRERKGRLKNPALSRREEGR